MSTNVTIKWNRRGLSEALKGSEGLKQELLSLATPTLEANNAEAYALASEYTSKGLAKPPYAMEVRELRYVPAAVIHSTNKLAALIGRENGLPHW